MDKEITHKPRTRRPGGGNYHLPPGEWPMIGEHHLPRRTASSADVLHFLKTIPGDVWNKHLLQWGSAQANFEAVVGGHQAGLDLAWDYFILAVETAGVEVPDDFFD